MAKTIDMGSTIVSDLFPLRPTNEEPLSVEDRGSRQLEARTMITYLERIIGESPRGVRLALLANHDNLVCLFHGDEITHWEYIGKIEKNWPSKWDVRAEIALGRTKQARNILDEIIDKTKRKLITVKDEYDAKNKRGSKRKNLRHNSRSQTATG